MYKSKKWLLSASILCAAFISQLIPTRIIQAETLVQTGESRNLTLPIILLVVAALLLVGIFVYSKRKKK